MEVERQDFACPAWEHVATRLEIDGQVVDAAANAYSPPCDVRAPTVPLGTLADLEAADLEGRICVLYGDLARAPLAAKLWFLRDERDARLVEVLEEKNPAALITVQTRRGALERLVEDWEFAIPSATVPARVGLALLQQPAMEVHLRIESRQSPGHTGNVVGRKAGERHEQIVLCAHYDTKIDTPGACDNGSGTAVLLALAQQLSWKELRTGLEFVAFTGHEYLPLGDDEYVQRGEERFGSMLAAINFDGVGPAVGANTITTVARSQVFHEHVVALSRAYPGIAWVDPWPESNHSTFAWRGVPSIAFSNTAATIFSHLRTDTIEWISPAKLGEVAALAAEIVEDLQDKALAWGRESEAGADRP
jgi:aminopeptidase YwaD